MNNTVIFGAGAAGLLVIYLSGKINHSGIKDLSGNPENNLVPDSGTVLPSTPPVKPQNSQNENLVDSQVFEVKLVAVDTRSNQFYTNYWGNKEFRFKAKALVKNISTRSVQMKKLEVFSPHLYENPSRLQTKFGNIWKPGESAEIEIEKELRAQHNGKDLTAEEIIGSIELKVTI